MCEAPGWEVGSVISEDERLSKLVELVRECCNATPPARSFRGREIANVMRGLAVLHVDVGVQTVDESLEKQLVEAVERRAGDMNSQEISMTLNALSKLTSVAGDFFYFIFT